MNQIRLYKNKYRIESTRLKHFDYSTPGSYFITICTKNRIPILGNIKNRIMVLSDAGCIVHRCWRELPNHYPNCEIDEFIAMPNHIHGIINLTDGSPVPVETGFKPVSIGKPVSNRHLVSGLSNTNPIAGANPAFDVNHNSIPDLLKGIHSGYADGTKETGYKPVSTTPIKQHSLSEIIRGFKTFSARKINDLHNTRGKPVWQARFYEHIISNESSMDKICEYIASNPATWDRGQENY